MAKLWDLQQEWLGRSVQILDFFHVLKRVREVAKLVEPDYRPRREVGVSEQVRDLLESQPVSWECPYLKAIIRIPPWV